jgi:hypothetical protein
MIPFVSSELELLKVAWMAGVVKSSIKGNPSSFNQFTLFDNLPSIIWPSPVNSFLIARMLYSHLMHGINHAADS